MSAVQLWLPTLYMQRFHCQKSDQVRCLGKDLCLVSSDFFAASKVLSNSDYPVANTAREVWPKAGYRGSRLPVLFSVCCISRCHRIVLVCVVFCDNLYNFVLFPVSDDTLIPAFNTLLLVYSFD